MSSCSTELNTLLVQIGPSIKKFYDNNLICIANVVFAITFVILILFMLFSLIVSYLPSEAKWVTGVLIGLLGIGSIWNLFFRTG